MSVFYIIILVYEYIFIHIYKITHQLYSGRNRFSPLSEKIIVYFNYYELSHILYTLIIMYYLIFYYTNKQFYSLACCDLFHLKILLPISFTKDSNTCNYC